VSDVTQILEVLLLITVPILAIGLSFPLGRALAARFSTTAGRPSNGTELNAQEARIFALVDARLATRIQGLEQAIDAIAVEVERIGEAQRYRERLLPEASAAQDG
jgi:hypothetical protein